MKITILKKLFVFSLLSSLGSLHILAQDSITTFFQREQSLLREKLYLHTDKPYYAAGDTIWFRGTLVNADTHSYLVKTNYIYVELISAADSLIGHKKLKREGLCFHNCFPLDVDLPEGDYYLRGYTEWMRNFDSIYFFSRQLSIANIQKKGEPIPIRSRDYAVTFLPEGGDLLCGIPQTIAYKAQRPDGFSEEIEGMVYAEQGDTLTKFSSLHNGMGTFTLIAPSNVQLHIITKAKVDGFEQKFTLPKAQNKAVALQVKQEKDSVDIHILSTENYPLTKGMRLVVHTGSLLMENREIQPENKHIQLATHKWPDGINHILLCAPNGNVISRRLIFVNNTINHEKWNIQTNQPTYEKREKVRVDFTLLDKQGKPLQGDFSVSITDVGSIEPDPLADNILSNLLLTSDLKGYIENPGWYFQPEGVRNKELDLLMLTHGWSRFETKNLHQWTQYTLPYAIEAGQYISGRVEGISAKESNNLIGAYNPDEKQFATDTILADGTFCLNGLDFPDSTYFGIRLLTKKKRNIKLYIDKASHPSSDYKKQFFKTTEATFPRRSYIPDMLKSYMLPEVEVRQSRRSQFSETRTRFYIEEWNEKQIQNMYDPNETVTALDFINKLINTTHAGKLFEYGCINFMDGIDYEKFALWGPLKKLYVNFDKFTGYEQMYSTLSRIRLYDIERIEFIEGVPHSYPANKNQIKSNSVMCIRFKPDRSYTSEAPDVRKRVIWPEGYAQNAFFYHPVYDTPEQKNIEKSDNRTTIYWNPSVQTEKDGKGTIVFYTSDSPENYHIRIEGVTFNRKVCRTEKKLF